MDKYRKDIDKIIDTSIKEVLPDEAIRKALEGKDFSKGRLFIIAIGKAAYRMAKAAKDHLKHFDKGIIITKYSHSKGDLEGFEIHEAGHPLMDENSVKAAKRVLELTCDLREDDKILLLLSGGASALFEDPLIDLDELIALNDDLLRCAASISEINCLRKHLSKVKGGRFALHCQPAHIYQIVLSDVLGNRLDVIGSGPAWPDESTVEDAKEIIKRYDLHLSEKALKALSMESPKEVKNVESFIGASVNDLCEAARRAAEELGYDAHVLSCEEDGSARDIGKKLALKALDTLEKKDGPVCLIMGGEPVVKVKGQGLGGRAQELALSAAPYIKDKDIAIFAIGSDGTDGPTDAAGAIVDGDTMKKLEEHSVDIDEVLSDNDSYAAFSVIDDLIFTGPTGTNVNDLFVALINKREQSD